jgi:N-acetyl-gamma-glutamyl-phosphate reductase
MRVFIDGAVGTTGLEIRDRLAGRTDIALATLPDELRKDERARRDALNAADVVILCLPDEAAREAVALIENTATRVIDASTAFRVAPDWTYGFAEIEPDRRAVLASATRVSNPGCYPTGFLALVRPLIRAGLVPADWPLSVNAVSGYSGGGKAMIAAYEDAGVPDATDAAFRGYALSLGHKHVPEMTVHGGLTLAPIFAPAVVRTYRGMIVEVPLHLSALPGTPSPAQIQGALADAYAGSRIVRVASLAEAAAMPAITIERAADSDRLELFVFASADASQARLVAALDNLGKGAAGAAVQTLNIMAGLDETTGLRL